MDRKSFSNVIDETFNKMESDVRVLKTQQQTLTVNIKDLEATRDKLSAEIAEGEKKLSNVQKEYKDQADSILKSAQDKLAVASKKESEASVRLSELNDKTNKADNIIKSNHELQKNLDAQNKDLSLKIKKLDGVIAIIQETLKNL